MEFKEWLKESLAMVTPSTGKGGGVVDNNNDEGEGGDGDEWDWDRLDKYRWNLLEWCRKTPSMNAITSVIGEVIEAHKGKKTSYLVLRSKYEGPKYTLQLNNYFDVDVFPAQDKLKAILVKSDLHTVLRVDPRNLGAILWSGDVMEYMIYIICTYLCAPTENAGSPFTQSHFKIKKSSHLSNIFAFKVWSDLKKKWDSSILPRISDIAIHDRKRVERPRNWTDVGKPEVKASLENASIPISVTTYGHEDGKILASVTVMIPFDWNYA